jgi:hypothetical protein
MRPWYAANARNLLETRRKGLAPSGPVIVSLIGTIEGSETTLYVHDDMPAERMDWRMLVNLEVWIWSDPSVALSRLLNIVDRIARARPRRLVLRLNYPYRFTWSDDERVHDEEIGTHDVEVGSAIHREAISDIPAQHEFVWMPFGVTHTPISAQMQHELEQKNGKVAFL